MDIKNWLEQNLLDYKFITDQMFSINNVGIFGVLLDMKRVFNEKMELNLPDGHNEDVECDYYVYQFGENYYYQPANKPKIESFNILKYLGRIREEYKNEEKFPFLGVHGGYDILNGSRSYDDWCKKAQFLEVGELGICEKNTLGGVMKFQLACEKNNIKPVIGAQYTVKEDDGGIYNIKCYIKDERGWQNLLKINTEVNVTNTNREIDRGKFIEFSEGLIIVFDPKYMGYKYTLPYKINVPGGDLFWQLDDVEFENDYNDKGFLLNTKEFMKDDEIPPILITDAYYLDSDEYMAKELLNTIADIRDYKSKNQYFKTFVEIFTNLSELFSDEERFLEVFDGALQNVKQVTRRCKFKIPTGVRLLPDYIMTEQEEKTHKTKEDLFMSLIQKGIEEKLTNREDLEKYLERIEEEHDVIAGNDYIDYFLILWDIIKWCRENGILVGIGRGSAGGSLIAYLLGIIEINPLDFDLLFERFFSHERARVSYPDIDVDFEASRRDEVKKYMEHRYGSDRVCSVGTYTNLKLKQAFKDLSRIHGVSFGTANFITKKFDIEEGEWFDVFKTAVQNRRVKEFISEHPEVIEDMRLILNQPKSRSIHACATIITPEGKNVYNSFPVRADMKGGETLIVSEWEGDELEKAGYLKEDILGVKQLDKYRLILDLIKRDTGKEIDIYNLPLDDKGVLGMFEQGLNGDIFHFGSYGLTAYCKLLKPESIHDLIAANSLYRPGAMEVNSHNEYVFRKHGEKEVKYKFMMEEVTSETYGLIVYQEQVMKVFQVLADFTLEEADSIRKAIVKKEKHLITDNKERFIKKCIEKGCSEEEARDIWHDVEVHAGYSFNKSHSAAYSIMGYIGQWLKYCYPLQFWTAAFQFDNTNPKESNINRYISEINMTQNNIKLVPPNINKSSGGFTSDYDKKEIYWSLGKVKQVGEKSLEVIIEERNKNGEFFSLKEFLNRINKRVVNKAVVINLILAGAFDELCGVENIEARRNVISEFYDIQKTKPADSEDYNKLSKLFWQLKQKEICGYGELDYKFVIKNNTNFRVSRLMDGITLQEEESVGESVVVAGIINEIRERESKKVGEYCNLELESNHEVINITLWNETFRQVKNELEPGIMIALDGRVNWDSYKECNVIHSTESTKIFIIN